MDDSPVNDQHRATADEWACVKAYRSEISFSCLLELRDRIKALEARNEEDKEAWAAMRRAGSSHGERIGALMKRIDALESAQVDPGLFDHKHKALGNQPSKGLQKMLQEMMQAAAPASSLSAAAIQAASEAFRAGSTEARPSENLGFGHSLVDPPVYGEAKPNHPASSGGLLLLRVACTDGPADAIREIAAWFREQGGPIALEWAIRLELEAEG